MKTKTQTPRATRHVPSTGAKHSIQIAWRRPSSDLKRRCRRLLRLLKKRSVPLSSRHRLSARAVSDSFGFIFSFALSVSLCVFCVFVGWIAESEDFFSRGAETREFFSREAARERGSLSRGSTQEKKSLAWQHAREGASRARAAGDWNLTRARTNSQVSIRLFATPLEIRKLEVTFRLPRDSGTISREFQRFAVPFQKHKVYTSTQSQPLSHRNQKRLSERLCGNAERAPARRHLRGQEPPQSGPDVRFLSLSLSLSREEKKLTARCSFSNWQKKKCLLSLSRARARFARERETTRVLFSSPTLSHSLVERCATRGTAMGLQTLSASHAREYEMTQGAQRRASVLICEIERERLYWEKGADLARAAPTARGLVTFQPAPTSCPKTSPLAIVSVDCRDTGLCRTRPRKRLDAKKCERRRRKKGGPNSEPSKPPPRAPAVERQPRREASAPPGGACNINSRSMRERGNVTCTF